jgi:hypothetical protein
MMHTAISILIEAHEHGQRLEVHGDKLRVTPADRCTKEFADTLRAHKQALLALLALPCVMVESKAIDELLFFCADESTKRALIDASADEWAMYTKAELKILVEQNRVAPFSLEELAKLHEIKKTFKSKDPLNAVSLCTIIGS